MTTVDGHAEAPATPQRRSNDRMSPRHPALLLPLLAVFGLFYVLPLLNVLRLSLFADGGFTLRYYTDVLSDGFVLGVVLRTVRVAATATVASVLLGYPLGVMLARARGWRRSVMTYAVLAPLLLSGVVRALGWLILLRPGGLLAGPLGALGLGNGHGLLFSESAIVIGLVHLYMPMLAVAVCGSVQQVDPTLLRSASSLGASRSHVFLHVLLPLTVPGLISGCLLVFSLSSSAFATPAILGGSRVPVASYLIYQQGLILGHWAAASALSMLLLLLVAAISLLSLRLSRRYGGRTR